MYQQNDRNQNNLYDPVFAPKPPKKHAGLKKFGKAVAGLALVACISVGSILGYNALFPPQAAAPDNAGGAASNAPSASPTIYLPTYSADALTPPEIFQKAVPSVVSITTEVQSYGRIGQGTGTGIVMSADGYIITNNHVVEGAQSIQVTLNDGRSFDAEVVGTDANTDIAVVKIDAAGLTVAEFGDSSSLVTGEPAYAIGNPLGIQFAETMTGGMISAPSREVTIDRYVMTLIQVDAAINPGNSGGPLVNSQGQVVGVVNAKIMTSNSNDVEGIGFAIPIETALNVANDLIEYGYVTNRPVLGVSVQSLTAQEAMLYRMEAGLTVKEVTPGGPAEKAGVQVDDKIIAFNGVDVETFAELNYEKDKCKPGDTVTLTVERNGSELELKVTLGSSSD